MSQAPAYSFKPHFAESQESNSAPDSVIAGDKHESQQACTQTSDDVEMAPLTFTAASPVLRQSTS